VYAQQMARVLESSAVVEQAKGALAERHRVTPARALDALAHAAMSTRTTLDEVAGQLIATGAFDQRYVDEVACDRPP
jgi:AmiR/NasT family two-component response regulator